MDETVGENVDVIMVNFFEGFSSSGRSGQWREARGENFVRNFEERFLRERGKKREREKESEQCVG